MVIVRIKLETHMKMLDIQMGSVNLNETKINSLSKHSVCHMRKAELSRKA